MEVHEHLMLLRSMQPFGKLTVISYDPRTRRVHCLCECGKTTHVYRYDLVKAKSPTRSCGCLRKDNGSGPRHPLKSRVERVTEMLNSGYSRSEIGREIGVSRQAVQQLVKRRGLVSPKGQ